MPAASTRGGGPRFPVPNPTDGILWKNAVRREDFFAAYHQQRRSAATNGATNSSVSVSSVSHGHYERGPLDSHHRSSVEAQAASIDPRAVTNAPPLQAAAVVRASNIATSNGSYGIATSSTAAVSLLPTQTNRHNPSSWRGRRRWDGSSSGPNQQQPPALPFGNVERSSALPAISNERWGQPWYGRRKWSTADDEA